MKTAKKIIIIVSLCLVTAGIFIVGIAGAIGASGAFTKADENCTVISHTPDGDFTSISVNAVADDVFLIPSDDGKCRVEYYESKNYTVDVSVSDNTLTVKASDIRPWYEKINFSFLYIKEHSIKIYLPENEYEKLKISTVSADISVPGSFSFQSAVYYSTSGDVKSSAKVSRTFECVTVSSDVQVKNINAQNVKLSSTSGDIKIEDISSEGISIKTTSGEIELEAVRASGEISVKTVSGEVEMTDTVSDDEITVSTTSGDVKLGYCDAKDIDIGTVSGEVIGILLTEKSFDVSSLSGNIKVPENASNGEKCRISTTSGNIKISIDK